MKKKFVQIFLAVIMVFSMMGQVFAVEQETLATNNKNLVVIVPGILGSELIDTNNIKVWFSPLEWGAKIQCNEVGKPVYPVVAYNDDNYGAIDTYKELYDELYSNFSNRADVKFFAYDWRLTNTTAAQRLKALVSNYSGEIVIVAHSMGGIVASEYLRIATGSQRNRTSLITLGTPFTGAPKAIQVMENGKLFPGIAGDVTSSYVINLIRNFPAAYELLPTSRSGAYIQVNGVDQTNTNAWNIMRRRVWSNIQSGSGVKPMMNTASTFHSNLVQSNGQHYALSAKASIFISSIGRSTISKVNYNLNGNTYSVSSYVTTNGGDGTVPVSSAQNNLLPNDSHIEMLSGVGDHVGMISNRTVLTKVGLYVSRALAGQLSTSTYEISNGNNIVENERGWFVGDGLDGRRIRVIIRGCELPEVINSDGMPCVLVGDMIYNKDPQSGGEYIGNCWEVSDGYQFEMLSDDYTFVFGNDGDTVSTDVMYMENGYYDSVEEYEVECVGRDYKLEVSNYEKCGVEMFSSKGNMIESNVTASEEELSLLNMD